MFEKNVPLSEFYKFFAFYFISSLYCKSKIEEFLN